MRDELRIFLESYIEAMTEVKRMEERHADLWDQATKVTSVISDMPKGGGSDKERLLAALADADDLTYVKREQALRRMIDIEKFIDRISKPERRMVLRYRYLKGLQWTAIALSMGLSESRMYQIHGEALAEARKEFEICLEKKLISFSTTGDN